MAEELGLHNFSVGDPDRNVNERANCNDPDANEDVDKNSAVSDMSLTLYNSYNILQTRILVVYCSGSYSRGGGGGA